MVGLEKPAAEFAKAFPVDYGAKNLAIDCALVRVHRAWNSQHHLQRGRGF